MIFHVLHGREDVFFGEDHGKIFTFFDLEQI